MCVSRASSRRETRRPRARQVIRVLVGAGLHGVEVTAKHDAGNGVARIARRIEHVEDGADLSGARVLEHPQCFRRADRLEMSVHQFETLRAVARLDLHGRAKRDAALTRQRQFERERIEQRLGRNDRVAAILAKLRAIAHRGHVENRQPERRGVIVDVG